MASFSRRDFTTKTVDGVTIAIREVRAEAPAVTGRAPMILLHGTRIPGLSEFDLPVPNGSLAEDLARAGHVCFIPDARGFGRSERPAAMSRPPDHSVPLVRSLEITRDVDAATDALRQATGAEKVGLFGWGTGGTVVLMYAALWPEKVSHVVLYNPLYGGADDHPLIGHGSQWEDPEQPGRFNRKKFGGYHLNEVGMLEEGWNEQIPIEDKDAWRDPAMVTAFNQALIDGDPESTSHDPPRYRSPNGMLEDSFYMGVGHKLVDATQVYCKVMVISPEYDVWCRPADVKALREDLVHAEEVRILEPPNTTHYVLLERPERGRDMVLREMLDFLS